MQRHDPEGAVDERSSLEQYLDYQRATVLLKTEGLSREQLAQRIPSSELTLAGLLKHLALVEDSWLYERFLGQPANEPWASAPWADDPDWEFHSALEDDPAELRGLYLDACARSRVAVASAQLDDLSAEAGGSGLRPSLRWVLLHLIEETARHAGHADLLREAIDGEVGE
jgi:hypothetical protein